MVFNEDVLSQIFEEIDDKNSLYSCLFVNRTWCVTAVPILRRNPNFHYNFNLFRNQEILLRTILIILSQKNISVLYLIMLISVKYLNLTFIENMIYNSGIKRSKNSSYKLQNIVYQLHNISGFECCFSKLESIHCNYVNFLIDLHILANSSKILSMIRFDIICQTVD
ncbi:hypothetical protein RhiirC2_787755 [Rhizophagus irregularis]|uniref:F-box domain-containing protein n=1 Tax=Rhizophagus irregularis TaxID=588596 RepID=A0A2N1MRL5_9GLOM|nr:hypothetical protein RhiirC2_787755 [Rhizophagus irregularis]